MTRPRPIRRRHLLVGSAAAAAALSVGRTQSADAAPAGAEEGGPPYAYYWYPDQLPTGEVDQAPGAVWRSLLDWDLDADPDLAFNTASVPLAERRTLLPHHRGQHRDQTRVQSLVSFAPTAQNPSQGSAEAVSYAFTHWAYVDELVFWGGSAGEGIILAPNAPVIDAAHRAGVPVLGNVFLPPRAYGGIIDWTLELIQRDQDGRFPVADKLIMVAERLGFDGWFINPETQPDEDGKAELATQFAQFLRYLEDNSTLRIVYYDALTEDGDVDWQNALTEANDAFLQDGRHRVSDEMFLNFWWQQDEVSATTETAERIGRSHYDAFFGIDTEAAGYRTEAEWDLIFDPSGADPYRGSLGLYRPEWTKNSLGEDFDLATFQRRDHRYWVGDTEPRPRAETSGWPGIAAYVAERTTLTGLPFTSAFGTGAGESYAVDGRLVGSTGWNNLSVQDVQPQRRWILGGSDLNPRYDYRRGFQAGESLLFDVPIRPGSCELFQLDDVLIGNSDVVDLWGVGPAEAEVTVEIQLDRGANRRIRTRRGESSNGWTRWTADLGRFHGRRLRTIGLRLSGDPGTFRLGQLSAGPRVQWSPEPATGLRASSSGDGVRVRWDRPEDVHHLEVYADGTFALATAGHGCYLPDRARLVRVVSVSDHYRRSRPVGVRVR